MNRVTARWKDVSISRKLYAVVGVMAVLIVCELVTLGLAMDTLSAVRALVGGEGLWSKAQKNAAFSLQRYALTREAQDYETYLAYLKIPDGDHIAREELRKARPDLAEVRRGFLQGGIHPDDIGPIIRLLRRFSWNRHIGRALQVWGEGDRLLGELRNAGEEFHTLVLVHAKNQSSFRSVLSSLQNLNLRLSLVEDEFSAVLGLGSLWLEGIVLTLLFAAVLVVESIGLSLTFLTARAISRGLNEISDNALALGRGDFDRRIPVRSSDEIGTLARALNRMGELLGRSYQDLERRVHERTRDLEAAVRTRDDFMSMASHELKTPLTSLKLQAQIRSRLMGAENANGFSPERARAMALDDERQIDRITRLVDEMLDITRLSSHKLRLNHETADLATLVQDLVARMAPHFAEGGCKLTTDLKSAQGRWDCFRIEQVVTNLLTNALKYGTGRPIHISVRTEGGEALLSVKDHGPGIAEKHQRIIFEKFERTEATDSVAGLGLGLFIAREIVSAHSGTISVKSQVGKGAEFIVRLPLQPAGTSHATKRSSGLATDREPELHPGPG